jgi:hypothetical protein
MALAKPRGNVVGLRRKFAMALCSHHYAAQSSLGRKWLMNWKLGSLALTVGCLTMACAAQAQMPEGCARHQARFPALLGKAPEEVRAALQAMPGITTVRMGGPNTPMTRDYRIDRASVLIENGVAAQITCG